MVAYLGDEKSIVINFVDYAVLIIDPSRPVPREAVPQKLGLAYPLNRCSLYFLNQQINTVQHLSVGPLPV